MSECEQVLLGESAPDNSSSVIFCDFKQEFLLNTDASDQGIGVVLSQIQMMARSEW